MIGRIMNGRYLVIAAVTREDEGDIAILAVSRRSDEPVEYVTAICAPDALSDPHGSSPREWFWGHYFSAAHRNEAYGDFFQRSGATSVEPVRI